MLPNFTPDLGGACSLLFELHGLTVIHDAAGCMENYAVFDEPRWFGARTMLYSSGLTQMDAVLGNEQRLIDQLCRAAKAQQPAFVAIVGSPVPYTLGMDLAGMAEETQRNTGIPAFALECGGFSPYCAGVDAALLALVSTFCREREQDDSVNLLGATPLDFSFEDIAFMAGNVMGAGASSVRRLCMGCSLDSVREASAARLNLVVSAGGLGAAKWMQEQFQTPYAVGIPLSEGGARLLLTEQAIPAPEQAEGGVLVLGEQVFAESLVRELVSSGIPAQAGITVGCGEALPDSILLDGEEALTAVLKRPWTAVVGDPLYRGFQHGGARFIGRPHAALSSHLFSNEPMELSKIIQTIKETK